MTKPAGRPCSLTDADRTALVDEMTAALNAAVLPIGERQDAAGGCFPCFLRATIAADVTVLADDVAFLIARLSPPEQARQTALVLEMFTALLAVAVKDAECEPTTALFDGLAVY